MLTPFALRLDELRRLANEVMELLQKHAGTTMYIEVYNKVHSHIVDVRRERKMKRDIQVCFAAATL